MKFQTMYENRMHTKKISPNNFAIKF